MQDLHYPENLPIVQQKSAIIEALQNHQVIVVVGETGSGKSTQLPKIGLEMGFAKQGLIACTQPRRIAATSLAQQVSTELNSPLGQTVGYQIRFSQRLSHKTPIVFMTDGILLNQIQTDKQLKRYSLVIIDEAHERSLNIDLLIGYMRRLLLQRQNLKLVLTSATIDPKKFAQAFLQKKNNPTAPSFIASSGGEPAPILQVSGRTYPVRIEYKPFDTQKKDIHELDWAFQQIERLTQTQPLGDILVFLATERQILELVGRTKCFEVQGFTTFPLYARLAHREQQKIFTEKGLKIILATNIAETSITLPGIRYVLDVGLARISRYNTNTRTHGLPMEAISQSSANQRKGRCGRVSAGVCVRLYSEEDYDERAVFTQPEIQRADLAAVLLQMLHFRLGDIENFDFLDAPSPKQIRNAYQTLVELAAIEDKKLTEIGQAMARMPVGPRIARMVLMAKQERVLYPVLVIAAGITAPDPREKHEGKYVDKKYAHPDSDLMSQLLLWEDFKQQQSNLSRTKLRRYCAQNYLSYRKMQEWEDLFEQLSRAVVGPNTPIKKPDNWDYAAIHRCLLAGYSTQIGRLQKTGNYQSLHNRFFHIFPSSWQKKAKHAWVVTIELIETSQLFAHKVAKIEPEWVVEAVPHLCKNSIQDPFWDSAQQKVIALKLIYLGGLCLKKTTVDYAKINPQKAKAIFIQQALVEEDLNSNWPFWKHNCTLIAKVREDQHRLRRMDLLATDQALFDFYQQRLPSLSSLAELNRFIRETKTDEQLRFQLADVLTQNIEHVAEQFPETIQVLGQACQVKYRFEPGVEEEDGVSIHLPKSCLGLVQQDTFETLVPGLLVEKIDYLLHHLPKTLRRKLGVISSLAQAVQEQLLHADCRHGIKDGVGKSLLEQLSNAVLKVNHIFVSPDEWSKITLPEHLKIRFKLQEQPEVYSTNLKTLQNLVQPKVDPWLQLTHSHNQNLKLADDFAGLLETVQLSNAEEALVVGYRGLHLTQVGAQLRLFKDYATAEHSSWQVLEQMVAYQLGEAWEYAHHRLHYSLNLKGFQFVLSKNQDTTTKKTSQVFEICWQMIRRSLCGFQGHSLADSTAVKKRVQQVLKALPTLESRILKALNAFADERMLLLAEFQKANAANILQAEFELYWNENCLDQIDLEQWFHAERLVKMQRMRLQKWQQDPQKIESLCGQYATYQSWIQTEMQNNQPMPLKVKRAFFEFCWMLEEWKVSIFAQPLKTAFPISEKRLQKFGDTHLKEYFKSYSINS